VAPYQPFKEAFGRRSVTTGLQEYIYYFAILIHSTPEVVLLAVDFDENFINVESIAVASVLSLQSACVNGTELDAPKADRFAGDRDAAFCQQVFDISMAQIEAIVEPDSVGDDVGRESVSFVCIHTPILPNSSS
jgi:hypothetical protein